MTPLINQDPISRTSLCVDLLKAPKFAPDQPQSYIPKDTFYPRYKLEDNASAILLEEGITDINGKVDPTLIENLKIPLSIQEKENVTNFFDKFFEILSSYDSIRLQVLPKDIFNIFFGKHSELYHEIELIGSAAMQALGVPFCKRLMEHLLSKALPDQPEKVLALMQRLFTQAFEEYLTKRFTKNLADIDFRFKGKANLPSNLKHIVSVNRSLETLVEIFVTKLPQLEPELDKKRRVKALEYLKTHISHMEWLTIDYPQFYEIVFRNLAFNKVAISSKEEELLGILNVGKTSETTADIVFALSVPRTEIFPSVAIPSRSILNDQTKDDSLFPEGENWIQAILDKMFGRCRSNLMKATEDDLKMLLCNMVKGDVSPISTAKRLVEIAREISYTTRHKTVRKILKIHPELRGKPDGNFPYFIAQMLKEAVDTHLNNDPLAAMAITMNASEMLTGFISHEELEIFVKEMSSYCSFSAEKSPLNILYSLFSELHSLKAYNVLARKMSLIKLCAFFHCQAKHNESNALQVYLRKHEAKTCLEVVLKGEKRSYSLMLYVNNTSELIRDAITFARIPRTSGESELITRLITLFHTHYKGPNSSPILDDLRFFDHKVELFEKITDSLSTRTEPYLLTYFLFATQAQLPNTIPIKSIVVALPILATKMRDHLPFLFDNLIALAKPEHRRILQDFRAYIDKEHVYSEEMLAKWWISSLSLDVDWAPLAYDCFVECLHQNPQVSQQVKVDFSLFLCSNLKLKDYRQALKLLYFIQQKQYASFQTIKPLFSSIVAGVLKKQTSASFVDDIQRLEIMVEDIHSKKLKNSQEFVDVISIMVPYSTKIRIVFDSYKKAESSVVNIKEIKYITLCEKIEELIALAKTDYETATDRLFGIKGQIDGESFESLIKLTKELLMLACGANDYRLIKILLNNRNLNDWLAFKPDYHLKMLLDFNEWCIAENIIPAQDLVLNISLNLLKTGKVQNPSEKALSRLVDHIMVAVKAGYSDEAYALRKSLVEASDSLLVSLVSKRLFVQCVELYYVLFIDRAEEFRMFSGTAVVDALEAIEDDTGSIFTKHALPIISSVIPVIENKTKRTLFEVIKKIIITCSQPDQLNSYLKSLSALRTLDQLDDLNFLFDLFKRFRSSHQSESLMFIENYTGPIQTLEAQERSFRSSILHSVKAKDWMFACRAFACNPYELCPDLRKQEEFHKAILETLSEVLKKDKLSLCELKWIFKILQRYPVCETSLIVDAIEKSEGFVDPVLAEAIWWVFLNRLMNAQDAYYMDRIILILLNALKVRNKDNIQAVLDKTTFIKSISKELKPGIRLPVFKGLCKAYMHAIKDSKTSDKPALFKQFDERATVWLKCLWPNTSSQNRKAACLDLLEIYLSEKGISMLPEVILHLSSFEQCEKNDDRFKRLLVNFLNNYVCCSEEFTKHDTIGKVMVNAARAGVPFLVLGKCLKKCHYQELVKVGLIIVQNCLSVKSFLPQEIPQLRSLKMGEFLKFALKFEDYELKVVIPEILQNKLLPLFLTKEENQEIPAIYAQIQLSEVVGEVNEVEKINNEVIDLDPLMNSMELNAPVLDVIINTDNNALTNFVDSFFRLVHSGKYNDRLLTMLLKMTSNENGLERWSLFVDDIIKILLEAWKEYNRSWGNNLLFVVNSFNQSVVNALQQSKTITKKQMASLKLWLHTIFYFELPSLHNSAAKYFNDISPHLMAYPNDKLEIHFTAVIMLKKKEECLLFLQQKPEKASKLILDIVKRSFEELIEYAPCLFYDHLFFLLDLSLSESWMNSDYTIYYLINVAFRNISYLPDAEKISHLNKLLALWHVTCERSPTIIRQTVSICQPNSPEASVEMFKKRLNGLLAHMTQESPPKIKDKFTDPVYEGCGLFMQSLIDDLKPSVDVKIRNKCISDMFEFYFDFVKRVSIYYNTPEDTFYALQNYLIFMGLLVSHGYSRHCIFTDKKALESFLNYYDFLFANVKVVPKDAKTKYKAIKEDILRRKRDVEAILKKCRHLIR